MKCDFCSGPNPRHRFVCKDFCIPHLHVESVGDWAACDACAALVNANDKDGLVDRSVKTSPLILGSITREYVVELHAYFWENRR